ncbi:MAG: M1 family metallopeptidase [Clostridia bacterium]|nr:M1 family metallopeptidase [Clostridia bacterium]
MKKFLAILLSVVAIAAALSFAGCKKKSVTLSEYDIFASYDTESQTLTGTVNFTFYNNTDNEIDTLKFNLFGNAFREGATIKPVSAAYSGKAYYSGASYGGMEITEVQNCLNWNVGGEDENILNVALSSPVYPEQTVSVTISYALKLANVNHRTGVTKNGVNLGNFYPVLCAYSREGFVESPYYSCGDPFLSECANYTVTVEVPATYTVAASGKLVSETVSSDRKKCAYSLNNARDFALVFSDKFEVATQNIDGVEVSYYYYKDSAPQESLAAACESLQYFSDTFGGYVYPTLSVVQTGFCYGGMEYPALTMISDDLDKDGNLYTIVHENAHQWWYAMVGSDQLNCAWQDEGLAEYSSLLFFENHPDYAFTRTGLVGTAVKSYRAYYSVYNQIFGEANTTMNRNIKDFESEYEYSNVAYCKGLILFDMLRQSIGDEKFFDGLKTYFKNNLYSIASCDDLIGCFIKGGNDVEGFFASFIEGKIVI